MTPLEALDKIKTMFLAYAPRDIREDKELNEDLFERIETAIKKQTRITVIQTRWHEDDLKNQSMFIGCLEETQKKLKALDFLKEHLTLITIQHSGKQLLDINYWDDEEGFDLVKEILDEKD